MKQQQQQKKAGGGRTQINKIRNEKGKVTTNTTETQRIMRLLLATL